MMCGKTACYLSECKENKDHLSIRDFVHMSKDTRRREVGKALVEDPAPEPTDTVEGLIKLNLSNIQSKQTLQTTSSKSHWKVFIPPNKTTIENAMTIPAMPNPPYTTNQLKAELYLLKSGLYKLNSKFNTQNYRAYTKYFPNRSLTLSIANAFDV